MLVALVLVCSLGATFDYAGCDRDTADYVMLVPGSFNNPTTCYLHGQAYLAGSELGRSFKAGDRIKVVCFHRKDQAGISEQQ